MNNSIVFLLRLWPYFGGGETVTISLANEFARRGYDVHVLYFKYTDNKNALDIDKRINVVQIEDIDCDDTHASEKDSDRVLSYLIEYIKRNKISIIINQWWPVSFIKSVKSLTDAKVITCNHTALIRYTVDYNGFKGFLRRIFHSFYSNRYNRLSLSVVDVFLPYVDKYVFLSNYFVKQYFELSGIVQNEQICAIPNPLPYDAFAKDSEIENKKDQVLFVGRIVDSLKRVSITLNAWKDIENLEDLKNWKLVIVGDGPDLPSLKEIVEQLGLKRVVFTGFQKPHPYYQQSKILVQNSKYEGFGMTIIEAQQNGCVPIAMDTFLTVHDLIESGNNGIITKDSQEDFTNQLITIMRDNEGRRSMALKGLNSSKRYRIENIVNEWERLFETL